MAQRPTLPLPLAYSAPSLPSLACWRPSPACFPSFPPPYTWPAARWPALCPSSLPPFHLTSARSASACFGFAMRVRKAAPSSTHGPLRPSSCAHARKPLPPFLLLRCGSCLSDASSLPSPRSFPSSLPKDGVAIFDKWLPPRPHGKHMKSPTSHFPSIYHSTVRIQNPSRTPSISPFSRPCSSSPSSPQFTAPVPQMPSPTPLKDPPSLTGAVGTINSLFWPTVTRISLTYAFFLSPVAATIDPCPRSLLGCRNRRHGLTVSFRTSLSPSCHGWCTRVP